MVKAMSNAPDTLLEALKAGAFYSSQGPIIEQVTMTEETVEIVCSPCQAIMALGRGSLAEQQNGKGLTKAILPLGRLRRGGFVRIAIADAAGRRAWTNPVWF